MADINYGEYTWKNCKFSDFKGETSEDALLEKIQARLGVTLKLSDSYKWNINYTSPPYVESLGIDDTSVGGESFTLNCILPENADPKDWIFKVKNGDTEITHRDPWSVKITDTSTHTTITEIAIGEKTLHKVYNSYQWLNQANSQSESYWPYGCILTTVLPATNNQIRVDHNTLEPILKRYSIPKFYVDNRSVSGYGWARVATEEEELSLEEGYQSKYLLSPFMTTRPKQMLYLSHQLRDPGFTILYNGWEWNKTQYTPITNVIIQNDIVSLYNNQTLITQYTMESGDVLIKCSVNQNFLSQVYRNLSLRDIYQQCKLLSIEYGSVGSPNFYGTIVEATEKTLVTDSTLWDTTAYNRWALGSNRFVSDYQDGYNILYAATASHTIEIVRQKDIQWTSDDMADFTNDILISTIDVKSEVELTAPIDDYKHYDLGININIGADLYPVTIKGKLHIQNLPILKFQRNTDWQLVSPKKESSLDWFYNYYYYQSSEIQAPCFKLIEGSYTISTFTPLLGIISEPNFYTSYLLKPFYFPLLGTTPPGTVYTEGFTGSSYVWPRLFTYAGWMPNDASVVCLDGSTTYRDNIINAWHNLKQYDHEDVHCSSVPFFEVDANHYLPPQDSSSNLYQHFDCYIVWHFFTPPDKITEGTGNGGSVGNATPF